MRTAQKLALVATTMTVLFAASAAQLTLKQVDRGAEWLSWSRPERSAFVRGFLAGYTKGTHVACESTDGLFEVGKSNPLGDQPSARCEALLETYSKYRRTSSGIDVGDYTAVITAQVTMLSSQQAELAVQQERLLASISLIQALGGGWKDMYLPKF